MFDKNTLIDKLPTTLPSTKDKPFSFKLDDEEREPLPPLCAGMSKDNIILGRELRENHSAKGVPKQYREAHFYIIGSTRTGKTKFLQNLIMHSLEWGEGFGVIDPHGDMFREIMDESIIVHSPKELKETVVVIDPTDKERTVSFNPLELPEGVEAAQQAGELVTAFKKLYGTSWGARMEAILRNILILLIENNLTITEVPLVLRDDALRKKLLRNVNNETCREYFEGDFDKWSAHTKQEWTQSTLNKIDAFLSDSRMRQLFCSPKSSFSFQDIFDNKKILLINLSVGELGVETSTLLGSLLLSKIQIEAMHRSRIRDKEKREPFYLYIDEFQNFASGNFSDIINETGKYNLSLTIANQSLQQLPSDLQTAALSCGLIACFRVTRIDAERLAKEMFAGVWDEPPSWEQNFQKLQSLKKRTCVVKNKQAGGVVFVQTPEIVSTREQYDAKKVDALFKKHIVGENYLRSRSEIEKEYTKRRNLLNTNVEPRGFRQKQDTLSPKNYEDIINGGENNLVEFKQALRWTDDETDKRRAEHTVAKALSAFMNSDGGTLFIGVDDKGLIVGLENDYAVLQRQNKTGKDSFILQLTQFINQYLGTEFNQYVNVNIISLQGKDVCVVNVAQSVIPVFVKYENRDDFYIRAAASSELLSGRAANNYIWGHFSKR